jgi:hypothetical protein
VLAPVEMAALRDMYKNPTRKSQDPTPFFLHSISQQTQHITGIVYGYMITYPYTIPSVGQVHAPLANNPNIVNILQAVNMEIPIGTPILPFAVADAENTVAILSAAKSKLGLYLFISTTNIFHSESPGSDN